MKTIVILFLLLPVTWISAQDIILNPTNPLPPCIQIALGETVSFERGNSCVTDVVILDINDIEVFRSGDLVFSYTFDNQGRYTIYCGAGPGAIAMAAICVDVGLIPTLSEWGIVCLTLMMLIVGCLATSQKKMVPVHLSI